MDQSHHVATLWMLLPPGKSAIFRLPAREIAEGERIAHPQSSLQQTKGHPFLGGTCQKFRNRQHCGKSTASVLADFSM